ncbi:MAG: heavy-metal-associated domain-containing protein [Cytophagales bacterium]|nr:heavy-metal-associated domain-containing protein [Cytophagales bacterium]
MRKFKILLGLCLVAFWTASFANGDEKTKNIKTYGNCGMCEERIETAATNVKGVTAASWDKAKKVLTVTFDSQKTDLLAIEKAVAAAGHDTENAKAKDEVYDNLHGCCKYVRPESSSKTAKACCSKEAKASCSPKASCDKKAKASCISKQKSCSKKSN